MLKRAPSKDENDSKKTGSRVSTTDPDASVMKMGDGGFRPAHNVQFATTIDRSGVVLGVSVSSRGSDQGEMQPMREQVQARTGVAAVEHLVDAGYVNQKDIEQAAVEHVLLLGPLPKRVAQPNGRKANAYSPAYIAWLARMGTRDVKARYKLRAHHAELTNARAKTIHGMARVTVRGTVKALIAATLVAVTINIGRLTSLRARAAAQQALSNVAPA